MRTPLLSSSFFFFNDTATTEIYTLSLHDALPILLDHVDGDGEPDRVRTADDRRVDPQDRKSTRLNSSHANISYAVFCLKKKKNTTSKSSYYQQPLAVTTLARPTLFHSVSHVCGAQ